VRLLKCLSVLYVCHWFNLLFILCGVFFCHSMLHNKVELFTATGKLSASLVESFLIAVYYRLVQCCTFGFCYSFKRVNVFGVWFKSAVSIHSHTLI
jgi:hypothetical protein